MWRRELNTIRTRRKNCPEICDPAPVSGSVPFLMISRHPVCDLCHCLCLSGHPVRGLSCYGSGVQDSRSACEPPMLKLFRFQFCCVAAFLRQQICVRTTHAEGRFSTHEVPEKYKISGSRSRLPPQTGSDDPEPGCGIQPGGDGHEHLWLPGQLFSQRAPGP